MKNIFKNSHHLITTCLLILVSTQVFSLKEITDNNSIHNHQDSSHQHPMTDTNESDENKNQRMLSCEQSITAEVNGLVCDFCARALEKVFSKRGEVEYIKVDLDLGLIGIQFHQNQSIDQETLTELINDSGYNVVNYKEGCFDA